MKKITLIIATTILSFSIGYSIGSSFECNVKETAIIANRTILM